MQRLTAHALVDFPASVRVLLASGVRPDFAVGSSVAAAIAEGTASELIWLIEHPASPLICFKGNEPTPFGQTHRMGRNMWGSCGSQGSGINRPDGQALDYTFRG
jgi:hypothetical protein